MIAAYHMCLWSEPAGQVIYADPGLCQPAGTPIFVRTGRRLRATERADEFAAAWDASVLGTASFPTRMWHAGPVSTDSYTSVRRDHDEHAESRIFAITLDSVRLPFQFLCDVIDQFF